MVKILREYLIMHQDSIIMIYLLFMTRKIMVKILREYLIMHQVSIHNNHTNFWRR